ncbi:MAG: transposase [Opitutales bacterium]
MSRVVGGQRLFGDREKEVLRKMLWQVADFCGVEILTYCVMSNHFHVLVRVPERQVVPDAELLRRFRVLYPKPTKYQTAEFARLEKSLQEGGEDILRIREQLVSRMYDLSEFMKTLKQRFSIWYNRNHGDRRGTLWMDRFKSVLVEGNGNPLQTMAGYIDLNPLRAGLVDDPKDYRFCGYAEAVAGQARARAGLRRVWAARAGGELRSKHSVVSALQLHRELIFGKRAADPGLPEMSRQRTLQVLEQEDALLPKATVLRCRVRYFTDGAILGSEEFVRSWASDWQTARGLVYSPKVRAACGGEWGDLSVIATLRRAIFL